MLVIPVAPSITEVVATLVTPNDNIIEHSITVTCTVRPDSDADMCVVMAMAVNRTTREGKYIMDKNILHTRAHHVYLCTYIL